jgi:hypothetical protein
MIERGEGVSPRQSTLVWCIDAFRLLIFFRTRVIRMTSIRFQPFLLAMVAVWATLLGAASVQAQSTNTAIQQGRVCINRTFQSGDSNDNATYQNCKININRTVQRGEENRNATAQFGRRNHNETRQSRGFKRTAYGPARSKHGKPEHHRSKRGGDHGRGSRNHDN